MVFSWFSKSAESEVAAPETQRGGYECVPYTVLETCQGYQVRSYPESKWATVLYEKPTSGPGNNDLPMSRGWNQQPQNTSFRKLFSYITGDNEGGAKISMTVPVSTKVTTEQREGETVMREEMGFYVPSEHQAVTPQPSANSDVNIVTRAEMVAYVREFGGYAKEQQWQEQKELLKKDLESRDDFQQINLDIFYRQGFDAPFKFWGRKNEVFFIKKNSEEMGCMEEVIRIRKELESLIENPEEISDGAPPHIEELDNMEMNLKILRKSKIGFTLNFLRKATSDDSVKKSAKVLIKKWQSLEETKPAAGEKKKTDSIIPAPFKVTAPLPTRNKKGQLEFEDMPDFKPNLTPKEVLQMGSFGGTYFRPIYSSMTKQKYGKEVWEELPREWLEGLDIRTQVSSSIYDAGRNKYKVKCGASLEEWETSGWIDRQDPYGWFQWYCRFYQGRRTEDDSRQVGRWARCAGDRGRWRNNLISKVVKAGTSWDNSAVSPVVRQTLQHWAYRLSQQDFNSNCKKFQK